MVGGMAWHGMAGRRKRVEGQSKRTSLFSIAFTLFIPYNPLLAMLNALHTPLHSCVWRLSKDGRGGRRLVKKK